MEVMHMTNSQQTKPSPAEYRKGGTMNRTVVWSTKTRELHNHYLDSTIWDDLRFRDDAIVISMYAKPGTTWIQLNTSMRSVGILQLPSGPPS
jgi:hypothetical protein